jgi:hypothetical protein
MGGQVDSNQPSAPLIIVLVQHEAITLLIHLPSFVDLRALTMFWSVFCASVNAQHVCVVVCGCDFIVVSAFCVKREGLYIIIHIYYIYIYI